MTKWFGAIGVMVIALIAGAVINAVFTPSDTNAANFVYPAEGGAASVGPGDITATELATNAVTNVKVADNAIGTAEIVNAAVLREDLEAAALVPNPVVSAVTNVTPNIRLGAIDGGTSGQTVLAVRVPYRTTFTATSQTTNASAVTHTTLTFDTPLIGAVEQFCIGQQYLYVDGGGAADGGVILDAATYLRYTPVRWTGYNSTGPSTFGGGNVTPMEREDDTRWSGPGVTFMPDAGSGSPGVALWTSTGLAATTVGWFCQGAFTANYDPDAGF